MAVDLNDEIVQDFLVEAGEILERLGEQLVELEQMPDDGDLLNAVFRSFHTIKGGAGFIGLDPLVALCHRAEDVFNVLRNRERVIDSALMDAVLKALDQVNTMFTQIRAGEEPTPAEAALLETLEAYAQPGGGPDDTTDDTTAAQAAGETTEQVGESLAATADAGSANGDITDAEFDALLDALSQGGTAQTPPASDATGSTAASSQPATAKDDAADKINDDEFEALLDQLHGAGQPPTTQPSDSPAANAAAAQPSDSPAADAAAAQPEPAAEVSAQADQEPEKPPAKQPAKAAGGGASQQSAQDAMSAAARPQAETTLRVDTKVIDSIMNMVGELVLVRNRLATLKDSIEDEEVNRAVANLDVVTTDLQNAVMQTRMQPVKKVFGRFPRVVRDLSRSLNKEVSLTLKGEDTDLDKNLVDALADPLVHLVRNAVDHGIEAPAERAAAGKPREGQVVLAAAQEGDQILLTIEDDGKGMDPDVLRQKAVSKGLMDEASAARLSDQDAFALVFSAGFSTKDNISDVSGRGVGMDVVKTQINRLNGQVEIDSVAGRGSVIRIKVPLTLAILPTLMVTLDQHRLALPLANVSEILKLDLRRTKVVDGQEVILVRGHPLGLLYLRRRLLNDHHYRYGEDAHVVVVSIGSQLVGLVVDGLIGQEEVVIKPLGAMLHGLPGFAGATITGDGSIALILDVSRLARVVA